MYLVDIHFKSASSQLQSEARLNFPDQKKSDWGIHMMPFYSDPTFSLKTYVHVNMPIDKK